MVNDVLLSANKAFSEQNFSKALALYEKCFPSNVKELAGILRDKPILKHVYRNYLYSLGCEESVDKIERLMYEYKAADPQDKIVTATKELPRLDNRQVSPLLSIIVPIHNSGQYLDFCIQSIREQEFADFELILINDGSTDSSAEIIERHALQDSRIKVLTNSQASGNPGTPRNQALTIARGVYVGFVDSDDWINRDFYSELMSMALESNADIAFSGGFNNHEASGRVSKRIYKAEGFDDPNSSRFKTHDSFMIWDKVFKRSMLEMFNIRLGETKAAVDVPFVFAAYYYASNVVFNDDFIGYNYRRESESSVTVAHRKNSNCEFEFQAFSNVRAWANSNGIADYYFATIDIKLVSSLMYTLKMVSDEYFDGVFDKVKALFADVDPNSFKDYCVQNQKWWLFKEFLKVRDHSSDVVKAYLLEKEHAAKAKTIEQLITPRYQLEGERAGILFFPCWLTNNPYQKLLYKAINEHFNLAIEGYDQKGLRKELIDKKKGEFKYIHLHWLHNFFDFEDSSVLDNTLESLKYAKQNGFEIIYTAHNICSHDSENAGDEKRYREQILSLVDHSLAHGELAKQRLISEFNVAAESIEVVPHGTYGDFYGEKLDKNQAKEKFGIPAKSTVFLFFGNIKGYKGIFNLLSRFQSLREKRDDVYLIIAGRVLDQDLMPELTEQTSDANILFRPGFVQNDEVIDYFSSADLCVLPYEQVLTSGAAMLSVTMRCPVLAPSIGILPEVITPEIGLLFDSFENMQDQMERVASGGVSLSQDQQFDKALDSYDWTNLVKRISFLRR
ncbi:glycosyltransferase [Alteromonas genovensis]|uniref:Glycosyltransferase n=1 Tax=Alteromonas genovensis TaxID=471225 RepID=A0A6N9TGI0_9ALTE|nr:glycosyltransferase [Alteromonas genovensis]